MQLDDVHGGHGQASTIHHAANAAIQANVVQIILTGCYIPAFAHTHSEAPWLQKGTCVSVSSITYTAFFSPASSMVA